jgi:hypothetical protein
MHPETASPAPDTFANAAARPSSHVGLLAIVGGLTFLVLVLTVYQQIHDTNFYSLFEATALLSGDHPYRDFFEWGMPLQVVISAGAQWLAGNRLIAEFLLQWSGIVIGAVIAFRIALRLAPSVRAAIVTVPFTLLILAATPTFHYPKLLFYPLAVWVSWRYLEHPEAARAAIVGLVTAAAFLFRHDHGLYIGGLSVLVFGMTRLARPASRAPKAMIRECLAYAAAVVAVIAPWLIVVQRSEGVVDYVRARAFLYQEWSAKGSPYRSLLAINPLRTLTPNVPAERAVVGIKWVDTIDTATREGLEERLGLRRRDGIDVDGRWQYEVQNRNDPALLDLRSHLTTAEGIDWNLLRRLRWHIPTPNQAQTWIMQMALLIPLLVLASTGIEVLARQRAGAPLRAADLHVTVAAIFLAVIDAKLFREPGYVVAVAPLTAALATRLLVAKRPGVVAAGRDQRFALAWSLMRRTITVALLVVTASATVGFARESDIFRPVLLAEGMRPALEQLFVSPPIDAFQPAEEARQYTKQQWTAIDVGKQMAVLIRYIHDCTRPGDRVLVTGSTPYQVGYYVERPIAGGHVFWHHEWRSDPPHLAQSLALLEQQSVPFAFSTHDPVLDDLKTYPPIRAYFTAHYAALEESGGRLLVDTRRKPGGTFGALGFPCFK